MESARQLLDELMGRNRNLDPTAKCKKLNWEDPEFCQYYLVKFCPHDLFVNTKADLGQCPKLHDDEAKRLYDEEPRNSSKKRQYEDEFLRFCNNMVCEVDRKIQKGRMRLLLMNRSDAQPNSQGTHVSKQQDQMNVLNDRIKKLVGEAEEAGHRGDVDQAQGLMKLCDQLKEEKDALMQNVESAHWSMELVQAQEKQMEVCEVCGAFLIVGDAQQRIEDHLTGKQHLGYSKVRKVIDEMYEVRRIERTESEKKRAEDERRMKYNNGGSSDRRRDDRYKRTSREDYDRRRDERPKHRSAGNERDRERDRYRSRHHRDRRRTRSRSQH
ncbi:luc7-like protein 3 [Phlebotomus argentipes]|uniref:luc7-like protein 3 n=1 Tax=Phlebotomus argentipes TaxID=94469 RepID=UPI002893262F|nr:luc7-like protein 3 [Phlebotomus argentipes]